MPPSHFRVGKIGQNDFYHIEDPAEDSKPACHIDKRLTHRPRHQFSELDDAMHILGITKDQLCKDCVETVFEVDTDGELELPDSIDYTCEVMEDQSGDDDDSDRDDSEERPDDWLLITMKANSIKIGEVSGPRLIMEPLIEKIDGVRIDVSYDCD
jgi:hypothetical protein